MLALAFLAQNLALGLSYGTYGAFVLHFVEEFDAPLSLAGSGLAITALVMGLTSPWTGRLVSRLPIGRVMAAGALCMAAGFGLLALAPSMIWVLVLYGLIGLGMVLLGPIPAMALITNWFQADRGKALGLGMVPLGIFLLPPLATLSVESLGWRSSALIIAGLLLASLPLLLKVQDREQPLESSSSSPLPAEPAATFLRPTICLSCWPMRLSPVAAAPSPHT